MVQLVAELDGENLTDSAVAQWLKVDARDKVVSPQRGYRIR
jgi:hypothetical protein